MCERKPPLNVVEELIRVFHGSLGEKNYGGDLPIHVACREGASKEVIESILNSDQYESAKVADCEGRLPLHLAAGNKNVSVKTIQDLVRVNERATRTPDDFKLLPLHWACSKNASPRVIETIIQAYPYAVEVEDAWGRTPLALAKTSKNPEKAHVVELLSRDISSWTSAMMSTVVTLSNKVLEAEKMESDYKTHLKIVEQYKDLTELREQEIEDVKLQMTLLEERFQEEIKYLKKLHRDQLEKQKMESDEKIAELTKAKEDAEKRVEDLKTLVDEVVSQLKQHQSIVDETESERKKLKEKAVEMLQKINDQKEENRATKDENWRLKQEQTTLRDEIERQEEDLRDLKNAFQQPLRMLHKGRRDFETTRYEDHGYQGTRPRRYDSYEEEDEYNYRSSGAVEGNGNCTKLDDGSAF